MGYIDNLLRGRKVEWKALGEVANFTRGKNLSKADRGVGNTPMILYGELYTSYGNYIDLVESHTSEVRANRTPTAKQGDLVMPLSSTTKDAKIGKVSAVEVHFPVHIGMDALILTHAQNTHYLVHLLNSQWFEQRKMGCVTGTTIMHLSPKKLATLPIPLPPLDVQAEIARILDRFTALEAELEARQKQYEYYRDRLLTFDKTRTDVEWKTLGEAAEYEQPSKYLVHSTKYNDSFPTPVLTAGKSFILGYTDESSGIYRASEAPIILFDDFTTASRWVDFNFKVKSSATKIITSRDEGVVLLKYIYYWLNTLPSECVEGDHKRRWISTFTIKKIPLPPLAEQERIVRILDKFSTLTTSLTAGLPREIALRRRQYEYYREQLLSFE